MTIDTNEPDAMNDLAGRIEGLSWAVLQLTAALEVKQVIDGPHLSKMWRQSLSGGRHAGETTLMRKHAQDYLAKLADLLDQARASRKLAADYAQSRADL